MKRKQSVRNVVWHIGRRCRSRREQKGGGGGVFPIAGLLGSVATPLIDEIAKPILKKIVGGRRHRRRYA